jgi:transketolase
MSIGMALAGRLDKSKGRVYVLLGDGELQEGLVWEAAMAAGHYSLDNLLAIVDWNGLQIDGKNDDVMKVTPIAEKFQAFGWHTISIDGHNIPEIIEALREARNTNGKPTLIVAKTHKGQGVSFMEDQAGWHGKAPNEEEVAKALEEIGGEWA